MEVVVLGSGSPLPTPDRAGPSTLVSHGDDHLLVDAGRGVTMRLAAAGVGVGQLTAVLLTHLHSDHVTDLNDVITTQWVTSFDPTPLRVVGPPGTQALVKATLAMLRTDIGYRMAHHDDLTWEPQVEVREVADGDRLEVGELEVAVGATAHAPVSPTVGYRVDDADGAAVVLAGDTVPCDGLDRLSASADVLVHTAIRTDVLAEVPLQRVRDVCDYHSGLEEVAGTATRAGVSTLVLTHLLPAPNDQPERAEWARRVKEAGYSGAVVVAEDLERIRL